MEQRRKFSNGFELEVKPADKTGMKPGGMLFEMNAQKVGDVLVLLNRISQTDPGIQTKVALLRKGKQMTLKAEVEKRLKSKAKNQFQN